MLCFVKTTTTNTILYEIKINKYIQLFVEKTLENNLFITYNFKFNHLNSQQGGKSAKRLEISGNKLSLSEFFFQIKEYIII